MQYPIAVLDASVLFSAPLRDILLRLAGRGLFAPRWTEMIHFEWIEAVLKRRPDITRKQLERTRLLMNQYVLEALVVNYEKHNSAFTLPDPDDHHVLAAGIEGGANIIITLNLKDFPAKILQSFQIQALHPDDFIMQLAKTNPAGVLDTMRAHRAILKKPPKTAEEYFETLEKQGLSKTVQYLKPHLNQI